MTEHILNIADALASLHPEGWVIKGGVYSGLEWDDDVPEKDRPTEEEINAELKRLQADYDSKQYQRDRAEQYPSIQDQLDMQYHDSVNGTTTWKDAIAKVKAENPKP